MRPTTYRVAAAIEKRAASMADILNLAKSNVGATAGAVGGGLYGAYRGATGPEADIPSALGGAAAGALGGALVGHAAHRAGRALVGGAGEKGIFGQISDARAAALRRAETDLGAAKRTGFLADARNIEAYRQRGAYRRVADDMAHVDTLAHAGMLTPSAGRAAMDDLTKSDPVHNYERLQKQLRWGGAGAAISGAFGVPLVMNAGDGASDHKEQIVQYLMDRYQKRGKLDDRELALLIAKTKGDAA